MKHSQFMSAVRELVDRAKRSGDRYDDVVNWHVEARVNTIIAGDGDAAAKAREIEEVYNFVEQEYIPHSPNFDWSTKREEIEVG